jgi:hypothetical protein
MIESTELMCNTVSVIRCSPFLTAEIFDDLTKNCRVVVLIAFASGTTPDILAPIIKKRINEKIPVIILTNNPGDSHGPLRLLYEAGQNALRNGAVILQTVNVNDCAEIVTELKLKLTEGISGKDLIEYMRLKYSFKKEELLPTLGYDLPNEVTRQGLLTRYTLQRAGLTGDTLNNTLTSFGF